MSPRQFAKTLRQNMTDAERLLWRHLRAHRLAGEKFRRQQPLGPYVADVVHFGARLVIEVDGGQHNGSQHDQRRDVWLETQGFKVLRFWNDDVLLRTQAVLEVIWGELPASSFTLSPNPSPVKGEGGADGIPFILPSPLAGEGPGERALPE